MHMVDKLGIFCKQQNLVWPTAWSTPTLTIFKEGLNMPFHKAVITDMSRRYLHMVDKLAIFCKHTVGTLTPVF